MENKFSILLASLESEEKAIQDAIKEFLEDGNYHFAFLQSKGLIDIQSSIYRLKKIEDPLFERKEFLLNRLGNIQKKLSHELTGNLRNYLLNELEAAEREREILERRQSREFTEPKQNMLDDCLVLLLTKQIKSFSITFNKENNIISTQKFRGKTLSIRLSGIKKPLSEGWLSEYDIRRAERIGFMRISGMSGLRLKLHGQIDELHQEAKLALARLTFEVLPHGCVDKNSIIEIAQ